MMSSKVESEKTRLNDWVRYRWMPLSEQVSTTTSTVPSTEPTRLEGTGLKPIERQIIDAAVAWRKQQHVTYKAGRLDTLNRKFKEAQAADWHTNVNLKELLDYYIKENETDDQPK